MGVHELSSESRKNIRQYNSTLAFTSILYTPDRRLGPHATNVPFQIHGERHHAQGPLMLAITKALNTLNSSSSIPSWQLILDINRIPL